MATIDEILLKTETTDEFIRQFMSNLFVTTKASNDIPVGLDFTYHIQTSKKFSAQVDQNAGAMESLIKNLIAFTSGNSLLPDDLTDSSLYEHVVDMIDSLLETADLQLDEASGETDPTKPIRLALTLDKDRILHSSASDIPKPQTLFQTEIDNSRERPFRPRLRTKPHGSTSLDMTEQRVEVVDADAISPRVFYSHPYSHELRKLRYPEWQIADPSSIQPWMPSPQQPFEYVDTEEALEKMIDELSEVREIAVDLEHHSFRSFQGIACLIQVCVRARVCEAI